MTANRRFAAIAALVVLLGLAVRIGFVVGVDIPRLQFSDAQNFHRLANNLADGEGYVRPVDLDLFDLRRPTAEYPPLFPAYLALWSLAGARSFAAHQVGATFLGATTVLFVALAARRVAGDLAGALAGVVAAAHPMLFQADAALMSEAAYAPLVALILFLVVRARERMTLWSWVAVGATAGAAALARGEGLILVPLVAIPAVIFARGEAQGLRRRVLLATATAAAAVAVVAPWSVRNTVVFDEFVPVSTNMLTVLGGANCPETYSGKFKGWWLFSCFERVEAEGASETEMYAAQRHEALEHAKDNLDAVPGVVAARVLRVWGLYDSNQPAYEATEGRSEEWQRAGTYVSYGVFVLALGGAVALFRARQPVWPFAAMFVIATVVAAITYGNQRFRIQADVASAVLAGVAIERIVSRFTVAR